MLIRLLWIALLVLLLAACRRSEGVQGPLIQSTLTPTPRSTALPAVATVVPPGTEDNPIQLVVRPPGSAVARSLITDFQIGQFQDALQEQSDMVIDVVVVDRYAEALAALCESNPTQISVAWVDGLSYAVALADACGDAVLQMVNVDQSGETSLIVTQADANLTSIQALRGLTFCRVNYEDYYGWLVPSLVLRANGLDPVEGFDAINDYPDNESVVEAVIDGSCDAAALSQTDFDDLSGSLQSELETLETSVSFPYGILMYPTSLTLGERIRLQEALVSMTEDSAQSALMEPLFGDGQLEAVDRDALDEFRGFLTSTGLNFAQLGN